MAMNDGDRQLMAEDDLRRSLPCGLEEALCVGGRRKPVGRRASPGGPANLPDGLGT